MAWNREMGDDRSRVGASMFLFFTRRIFWQKPLTLLKHDIETSEISIRCIIDMTTLSHPPPPQREKEALSEITVCSPSVPLILPQKMRGTGFEYPIGLSELLPPYR